MHPSSSRPVAYQEIATMQLDGKVALITGASRGLGRALAMAFAREGAALALCARGEKALEQVAAEVSALGAPVLAVPADVRSTRDLERLVALTLDRYRRVDILVNNASELGPTPLPYLADYAPAAFDDVLQVNVVAPFRLTQALIGSMLLRDRGVIINVTSDAAVAGYPGWGAYAVSKAALEGLTRTWAAELMQTSVRIYSVDPGDMDTDMHRAAIPDADPSELARPDHVALAFVRLATTAEADLAGRRLEAAALGR
jgi:NAD(P)-dependent dehydrogenase (short-subunit alcohol dehydrogenase family)